VVINVNISEEPVAGKLHGGFCEERWFSHIVKEEIEMFTRQMNKLILSLTYILIIILISFCVNINEAVVEEETFTTETVTEEETSGIIIIQESDYDGLVFWENYREKYINTFSQIINIVLTPNEQYIVSLCHDTTIKFWDFSSRKILRTIHIALEHKGTYYLDFLWDLVISPDGKYIVTGTGEETVKIWEFCSGNLYKLIEDSFLVSFALSPDGKKLVTGGSNGIIKILSFPDGNLERILTAPAGRVWDIAVSPDNNCILACCAGDKSIKMWELSTGELLRSIKLEDYPYEMAVSPDSKYIVAELIEDDDYVLKVWELDTGILLRTIKRFSGYELYSLVISNDSKYIIGGQKELEIWELSTGKWINTISINDDNIYGIEAIVILKDGESFLTGGWDKRIKLWRFDDLLVRDFPFPDSYSHVEKYRTDQIDPKVKTVPEEIQENIFISPSEYIFSLIDYLMEGETDDFKKIKLIHDWIIFKIEYDYEMTTDSDTWEEVILNKMGICGNYTLLFRKMCEFARFEAIGIPGWVKMGLGDLPLHAWNAVKIQDLWYLVDVTYDYGTHSTWYLFTRPELFICTHYPFDPRFQFLSEPYYYEDYNQFPIPRPYEY
jgi:WD40 repeat protein